MKTIRNILLALFLLFPFFTNQGVQAQPAQPWQGKVDRWVLDSAAQGETEFLVYFGKKPT